MFFKILLCRANGDPIMHFTAPLSERGFSLKWEATPNSSIIEPCTDTALHALEIDIKANMERISSQEEDVI